MNTITSYRYSETSVLFDKMDLLRVQISQKLDPKHRAEKGQYFTPSNLARFMASMFNQRPRILNILDAGAGIGTLSAALTLTACDWEQKPDLITITAYESEREFLDIIADTYNSCENYCENAGIAFRSEIICGDFIREAAEIVAGKTLFAPVQTKFNAAILNPPYKKINSISNTRRYLHNAGIETSNLYTAFLWLAYRLMNPEGEVVSITPRSFCNGPYFFPFRKALLKIMSLKRIHIFESRDRAFNQDEVLQENIILQVEKTMQAEFVTISASAEPNDEMMTIQEVGFDQLVHSDDPNLFIHIVPDRMQQQLGQRMRGFRTSIIDLGISVSTGKVVDFRVSRYLSHKQDLNSAPLIYPAHFEKGFISWPNEKTRKPNALNVIGAEKALDDLLIPSGWYVLVRRFSAKEEKRRLVAAVVNPDLIPHKRFGIENHLNFFHRGGYGLEANLAKGLAGFLNSTLVDEYFRQFSGHTQVNATDLRNLRYPNEEQLIQIGSRIGTAFPEQAELDQIVMEELGMTIEGEGLSESIQAKEKIDEALKILRVLGMPRPQLNQRSALTLLALLGIKPNTEWSDADNPMRGITEMMEYFRDYYGVTYAPNTREKVRRQTVHQFMQSGLVLINPDDLTRPVNSPHTKYQIEPKARDLLKTFGTYEWEKMLKGYMDSSQELRRLQIRERSMTLIPVKLPNHQKVHLTVGGQNPLIKQIIEELCPRFTPDGILLYLGDAGDKFRIYEKAYLAEIGIEIDEHSKMPDVIVHLPDKNWLVLIEAVTSHGPIDIKRHNELHTLFKNSLAPIVFITAFPTRKTMVRFLSDIAWETDVWVSENPTHLIHFNGERFLGPYD